MLLSVLRLLRRCPLLWLPVLVTDLFRFSMERVLPSVYIWIAQIWPKPHSVLSGAPMRPRFDGFHGGALIAAISLRIIVQLVELGMWTSAFVFMAASLENKDGDTGLSWRAGWSWLEAHAAVVAVFSTGCWAALALANAVLTVAFREVPVLRYAIPGVHLPVLTPLLLLPLCCAAGVIALRLLPSGELATKLDRRSAARWSLFWVVLSQLILMATILIREPSYTNGQSLAIHATISLIAAIPYVLLFLTLGLLVVRYRNQNDLAGAEAEVCARHSRAVLSTRR